MGFVATGYRASQGQLDEQVAARKRHEEVVAAEKTRVETSIANRNTQLQDTAATAYTSMLLMAHRRGVLGRQNLSTSFVSGPAGLAARTGVAK